MEEFLPERLAAQSKDMEDLVYSISHDLRAPLRHIRGYADILTQSLRDGIDAASMSHFEVIRGSVDKIDSLIADLLEFSRLSRADFQMGIVDMNELTAECVHKLQAGDERPVSWNIGVLPLVRGDRTLLAYAIMELLKNALKFSERNPNALIEMGCLSEEGGSTVIYVRDNGVGFNSRYGNRLFRVFQRMHGGEQFQGRGMGLAKTRSIVERHAGRIWAEAEVEKGATFFFTLRTAPGQVS